MSTGKPIMVNGVVYPSRRAYAQTMGESEQWVSERIRRGVILGTPKQIEPAEIKVWNVLDRLIDEDSGIYIIHNVSLKNVMKGLDQSVTTLVDNAKREFPAEMSFWNDKIRCDFYLVKDGKILAIIEVDEERHFKNLQDDRHKRDMLRKFICEANGIPLFRIKYTQLEDEELIEDMLQNLLDNPDYYVTHHNMYLSEKQYWSHKRGA